MRPATVQRHIGGAKAWWFNSRSGRRHVSPFPPAQAALLTAVTKNVVGRSVEIGPAGARCEERPLLSPRLADGPGAPGQAVLQRLQLEQAHEVNARRAEKAGKQEEGGGCHWKPWQHATAELGSRLGTTYR